jgi:FixJ family two-component response regulator
MPSVSACGNVRKKLSGAEMVERLAVAVIDDDESVRESLPDLLGEFGLTSRTFSSAEEFLASGCIGQFTCLILDISMPGMSGLELQAALRHQGKSIPIIFITARADERLRSRAVDDGAVDCLFKPFSDAELLRALDAALNRN